MADACHICAAELDGSAGEPNAFACGDCGELTCPDCKSFGVAREDDYCQRCRG